jgi:hydrogenase maturation protein HypF
MRDRRLATGGVDVMSACVIQVRGVVQGVGFRPFVFRLAHEHTLAGWVLNAGEGVHIHLEGEESSLRTFVHRLEEAPPPAAVITAIDVRPAAPAGISDFTIRESLPSDAPTAGIAADLPICADCLRELFDPGDCRYRYPYINCTNCGPRYSVILRLPYDRPATTMKDWPLDARCAAEYDDPGNRRFHAQPVACPHCGPGYFLRKELGRVEGSDASIDRAAAMLRAGQTVAVKGLGGYHLACDARNALAVSTLRERKYRKEKPFALMVSDIARARAVVDLTPAAERLLTSPARPVVLARARVELAGVAPDNDELGVMLPYTPLHHLLFSAGAPDIMVMTSANRSSEPMAYEDRDAIARLSGIADAFLVGARPIARRVDDSVVRQGALGSVVLRRARGHAPGVVATLPIARPVLALGGDLKNTITLVVGGQAVISQHIGDLEHYDAMRAFEETIRDLTSIYRVRPDDLLIVHDAHPEYLSTVRGSQFPAADVRAVQHHRAHLASVLAEREAWDTRVIGVSLDGTGYGDDGTIWGGELFVGSVRAGFERVAHLRPASLAGGDAAARHPVQAAAGFLAQIDGLPDLTAAPFHFPERYRLSLDMAARDVRTFTTTSVGRLFDAAAALLGFTRAITFEGQAAMWVEQLARRASCAEPYPFPFAGGELDFRPLLHAAAVDRRRGRADAEIARAFHGGVARGVCDAATALCRQEQVDTVVVSGGVFQNELLSAEVQSLMAAGRLAVWANHVVPPNDGGISLGQAAIAALAP